MELAAPMRPFGYLSKMLIELDGSGRRREDLWRRFESRSPKQRQWDLAVWRAWPLEVEGFEWEKSVKSGCES